MAKIVLSDTASGYNLAPINNNFSLIEDEFQFNVLYRNNPDGEPNHMEQDLDMNNNNLVNVRYVNGEDLSNLSGNLTTVSDLSAEVETVAGLSAEITSLGPVGPEIQTVANNITAIQTANANITNIDAVATDISNVNTVADNMTAVVNVNNNLTDVTTFAELHLGAKASAPTTDNDGNPLQVSAQYYNTTDSQLYIWTGTAWDEAAFVGTSAVGVTYDSTGNDLTATDVQAAITELQNEKPFYDEIETTLTGDFDNVAVRFVRIGSKVSMTFLDTIAFTNVDSFHLSQAPAVPVGFRNTTAPGNTFDETVFWSGYQLLRIQYNVQDHRFQVWASRTDTSSSADIGSAVIRPTIHWVI